MTVWPGEIISLPQQTNQQLHKLQMTNATVSDETDLTARKKRFTMHTISFQKNTITFFSVRLRKQVPPRSTMHQNEVYTLLQQITFI